MTSLAARAISEKRDRLAPHIERIARALWDAEEALTGSPAPFPFEALAAHQQRRYLDAAKAAVAGRIGHLGAKALGRTLDAVKRTEGIDDADFTPETQIVIEQCMREAVYRHEAELARVFDEEVRQ